MNWIHVQTQSSNPVHYFSLHKRHQQHGPILHANEIFKKTETWHRCLRSPNQKVSREHTAYPSPAGRFLHLKFEKHSKTIRAEKLTLASLSEQL